MLESDTKHAIPLALPGIPTGPANRGGKHNGLAATFHQGRPGPWHPPETSGWPWPTPTPSLTSEPPSTSTHHLPTECHNQSINKKFHVSHVFSRPLPPHRPPPRLRRCPPSLPRPTPPPNSCESNNKVGPPAIPPPTRDGKWRVPITYRTKLPPAFTSIYSSPFRVVKSLGTSSSLSSPHPEALFYGRRLQR